MLPLDTSDKGLKCSTLFLVLLSPKIREIKIASKKEEFWKFLVFLLSLIAPTLHVTFSTMVMASPL